MTKETKALVDKANELHAIYVEKVAEKKRFWDAYSAKAKAVNEAETQEAWRAARDAFITHSAADSPETYDISDAWRQACSIATAALQAENGLKSNHPEA